MKNLLCWIKGNFINFFYNVVKMINDINYFFYSRSIDVFDTSEIINTSRCILQRMTPELISNCAFWFFFSSDFEKLKILNFTRPVINWEGAHFVMRILVKFMLCPSIISKGVQFKPFKKAQIRFLTVIAALPVQLVFSFSPDTRVLHRPLGWAVARRYHGPGQYLPAILNPLIKSVQKFD